MKLKEEKAEVPISPLIDVVFLLIMFFVVTASAQQDTYNDSVKVPESKFLKPVESPHKVVLSIDAEGNIKSGIRVWQNDAQLKSYLNGMRQRYGDSIKVIFRADRDSLYKFTDRAIKVVGEAGLTQIMFQTQRGTR